MKKELPDLMTPLEVAKHIRRSVSTLARDRMQSRGIPYVKYGHNVFYKRDDVLAYLDQCTIGKGKPLHLAG
jgi:hypothetical protein